MTRRQQGAKVQGMEELDVMDWFVWWWVATKILWNVCSEWQGAAGWHEIWFPPLWWWRMNNSKVAVFLLPAISHPCILSNFCLPFEKFVIFSFNSGLSTSFQYCFSDFLVSFLSNWFQTRWKEWDGSGHKIYSFAFVVESIGAFPVRMSVDSTWTYIMFVPHLSLVFSAPVCNVCVPIFKFVVSILTHVSFLSETNAFSGVWFWWCVTQCFSCLPSSCLISNLHFLWHYWIIDQHLPWLLSCFFCWEKFVMSFSFGFLLPPPSV